MFTFTLILLLVVAAFVYKPTRTYLLSKLGFIGPGLHTAIDKVEAEAVSLFDDVKSVAENEEKKLLASSAVVKLEKIIADLKEAIGS